MRRAMTSDVGLTLLALACGAVAGAGGVGTWLVLTSHRQEARR